MGPTIPMTTRAAKAVRFILVLTALLLPSLSLLPFGGLYLWEKGWLLWWALGALGSVAVMVGLQRWLLKHPEREPPAGGAPAELPDGDGERPGATWSPIERRAWGDVLAIAKRVEPEKLRDMDTVLALGQSTIEAVARRLHPGKHDAVWHFTMPEALAISERVAHQLRRYVQENVPFGDRLTVAQVLSIYRWRGAVEVAERAYDVWRLIRLVNPVAAVTNEARERLSKALIGWGREHVTRRLAEYYVEEVGRAAIDLYGGRLRIEIDRPRGDDAGSAAGTATLDAAMPAPVKVLVTGRTAGERASVAALIASAERAAAEAWLARSGVRPDNIQKHDSKGQPRTSDPVSVDVLSTGIADGSLGDVATIVAEAEQADIVLLIAGRSGLSNEDRAVLSAASQHFNRTPSVLAPVLIPLLVDDPRERSGEPSDSGLMPAVAACYGGTVAPVVEVGSLEAGNGGDKIWSAIEQALPRARRVATLRRIDRMKRRTSWREAGWQATSAAGSLARALWKKRGGGA